MTPKVLQAPVPPSFTEVELLELLAALDDEMDSTAENVKMEEQVSVWNPSVNVVLDGGILASESDFEHFMMTRETGTSPVGSLSLSGVGTKRAPPSVIPQRPKRCRKTRKQEIDHLRAVATELEKKLKELNQMYKQDNSDTDPFWKRVSNRLLEQRQKSAVENARLRDLVRKQMTTCKTLQRTLQKNPVLSQKDVFPEVEEASRPTEELYRDMFRNLSILYSSGVDTMLPQPSSLDPGLHDSQKMNIEVEKDNNDGLRMCLEVVETKIVPSSFAEIKTKAWKILKGTNGHESFELTIQNRGDEMFGSCKLGNAMGPMQLLGNVAVRQFVEANKLTIVWECEGDVHHGDSKKRIQPKGWCVFEPAEEDPANATIFRRCAILSPIIDDTSAENSIGATTELVLENYKRTVVHIFDGMLASLNNS